LLPELEVIVMPRRIEFSVGKHKVVHSLTNEEWSVLADLNKFEALHFQALMNSILQRSLEKLPKFFRISITTSHHISPVWLVDSPDVQLSWKEYQAWASEFIHSKMGISSDEWKVIAQPNEETSTTLISAIHTEFFAYIQASLKKGFVTVIRVEPWLARFIRRFKNKLKNNDTWVALVEPEKICLVRIQSNEIRSVKLESSGYNPALVLKSMLQKDFILLDGSAPDRLLIQPVDVEADWHLINHIKTELISFT